MPFETIPSDVPLNASSAAEASLAIQAGPETSWPPATARVIVSRSTGQRHGPVIRMVSPGDLGEILKPFVFLDYFESSAASGLQFGMHPHSGLATTTVLLQGEVQYEDTTGASGILPAGGVEWMNAGSGVWHGGGAKGSGTVRGYQLWTALPPSLELGAPVSQYLSAEDVPLTGPASVILGSYGGGTSPVMAPSGINYVVVRLSAGEQWQYTPPPAHTIAWLCVQRGALQMGEERIANELVIFDESEGVVSLSATEASEFVIGSAIAHPHKLVLGYYSVHTSAQALRTGEARIREIGAQLRRAG